MDIYGSFWSIISDDIEMDRSFWQPWDGFADVFFLEGNRVKVGHRHICFTDKDEGEKL